VSAVSRSSLVPDYSWLPFSQSHTGEEQ